MQNAKPLWIKTPLATFDGKHQNSPHITNGIVIENGIISQCLSKGEAPAAQSYDVLDASQHVLMPGLINTHHHFYQTLTRACPPALNKKLFPWLQTLYPIWAGLQPEQHAVATELAMVELLLSGCTTVSDHHYLFPQP